MLSLNPWVGVNWSASYQPIVAMYLYTLREQCMSYLHSPIPQTFHQPNERPWVNKIQTLPSKNLKFRMEDIFASQFTITRSKK